jgi:hypothetical protein
VDGGCVCARVRTPAAALRFFGRGLCATALIIAFSGLRHMNTINFAGGGIQLFVGAWTLALLSQYGVRTLDMT